MSSSPQISRNDFVKVMLAALGSVMGAIIGLPAIGYIISPALKAQKSEAWVPLGGVEEAPVGVPTLFNFTRAKVNGWERTSNSYGVYVLRKSEAAEDMLAFSSTCTHLSCRVSWKEETQEYTCPCHDAHFGKEGEVLSGPPPRPLDRYEVKVEEGKIFIRFEEG